MQDSSVKTLTVPARDVLIRHLRGPMPAVVRSPERDSALALVRRGLARFTNDDRATELTKEGRSAADQLLGQCLAWLTSAGWMTPEEAMALGRRNLSEASDPPVHKLPCGCRLCGCVCSQHSPRRVEEPCSLHGGRNH